MHVSARLWVAPIPVKKPDDDAASLLGQGADGRSDIGGVSPTMLLVQVLGGDVLSLISASQNALKLMNKPSFGQLRVGRMAA